MRRWDVVLVVTVGRTEVEAIPVYTNLSNFTSAEALNEGAEGDQHYRSMANAMRKAHGANALITTQIRVVKN